LYDARTGSLHAFNGSGAAARKANREFFVSQGHTVMPLTGIHAPSVPGAPHAYWTLHQRFGSKPWAALVEPALQYAERGIPANEKLAAAIRGSRQKLEQFDAGRAEFFPGGEAPVAGAIVRRPGLARTLRTFAAEGAQAIYQGSVAREMVRYCQAHGSLFTLDDFAAHETEVYTPIRTTYRGVEVYGTAPPSQGFLILEQLNILEGFDLAASGFGSAETIHLMVEAKKLAFADRLRYPGDPRFVENPLAELLSKSFAARRRRAIDPPRAAAQVVAAPPEDLHGETSYFCVADGQGNAISFIHSLCGGWGSGVTAGETGIVLNNRAGRGFMLEAGHPNVIEGGKRTMHTLTAYLLMRDGSLLAVGGTPGGDRQPQWNVQVISNLLDHGMDVQQAVEAPRWESFPGTDEVNTAKPFVLQIESRHDPAVLDALAARGHHIENVGPWGCRSMAQVIVRQPSGVLAGGSDPRSGGIALGF
jgi:gamma-glutamyltranspeptidase/glutathione hydrolase